MSEVSIAGACNAGLTAEGCRARQQRLQTVLSENGWDAALCADPRYVHYLTGYWCRPVFQALALVERGGPVTLVAPLPAEDSIAADQVLEYTSNRLATLVEDPLHEALAVLQSQLRGVRHLAVDDRVAPRLFAGEDCTLHGLQTELLALRRRKEIDEVQLLERAVRAAEAAYAYAYETLAPGVREIDLYAGMLAAAIRAAGEPLGDFGNDFQIGSLGSLPRTRPAQAGEIAIFDVGVTLRGYRCDLCRSFVVGRRASDEQSAAHARVVEALNRAAQLVHPGKSCVELFAEMKEFLHGYGGHAFAHHLGHGIGLDAHEAPRLNPNWSDTFAAGDVFTIEPGLYGPALRAGLRIEENFYLGPDGLVQLSQFPVTL